MRKWIVPHWSYPAGCSAPSPDSSVALCYPKNFFQHFLPHSHFPPYLWFLASHSLLPFLKSWDPAGSWSAGKQNEEKSKLAARSLGSSCWRQRSPLIHSIAEFRFQGDCCPGSHQCTLQWPIGALPGDAPAAKSSRGLWWTSDDKGMACFDPLLRKASSDSYAIYNINHHELKRTNCSRKSWHFTPGIYTALCHR